VCDTANADVATCRGELDRVRDEVVENLEQPPFVGLHRDRGVRVVRERDPFRHSTRLRLGHRLARNFSEIELARTNLELSRLDLRDEQQVVHELQKPVGIVVDDVQIVSLLFGQVGIVQRQLEIADDRRQRCAQLVGDERHELVHEPFCFAHHFVSP